MSNPFAIFVETMTADRRLVILRLLVEVGGELGDSMLQKGLVMLHHRQAHDRDLVRADLEFLADAELVVLDKLDDRVWGATITKKGVALTKGAVQVAGVSQPSMGV